MMFGIGTKWVLLGVWQSKSLWKTLPDIAVFMMTKTEIILFRCGANRNAFSGDAGEPSYTESGDNDTLPMPRESATEKRGLVAEEPLRMAEVRHADS